MAKNLRERAELTTIEVLGLLGLNKDDHPKEVADAIENAIAMALVDERHRCADIALETESYETDKAKMLADEIRAVRSVLVSNLSSMR